MADGVTHLATAALPSAWSRHRAWPLVGLGTVLPDVASRAPGLALERVAKVVPLPEAVFWPWGVLHEPVGYVLLAGVVSGAFRPEDRRLAWRALVSGGVLHWIVDVLQDHHGVGYRWLAPFSGWRWELGWIGSEATVVAAPFLAVATLVGMAAHTRRRG